MKSQQALFLFIILLLGLFLCSFLGGNCGREGYTNKTTNTNAKMTSNTNAQTNYDNYNHFSGSSTLLQNGTIFTSENKGSIVVKTSNDGSQILELTLPNSKEPVVLTSSTITKNKEGYVNINGPRGSITKFYGPYGETATIITLNNGRKAIKYEDTTGTYIYTSGDEVYDNVIDYTQYYGSTGYHYMPNNRSGYNPPGYNPPGTVGPYNPPGYNPPGTTTPGYNPPGTVGPYNPPGYNPPGVGDNTYYDSLSKGIPRSQIPPGEEDMYILKSQVVPPVCPVCPSIAAAAAVAKENNDISKCPPCPACARCPEPSFECKKIPNYRSAGQNEYLPVPVLSDFSSFGM
jgi:hypothetical protein